MHLVWHILQWPPGEEVTVQHGKQQQDLKSAMICRNERFAIIVISLVSKIFPMDQMFRCCANTVRLQTALANLQLLVSSSVYNVKKQRTTVDGGTCW